MSRQPPALSPEPPDELRVVLRLSNRDSDLKLWLWQNRASTGAVLRQALRAELIRRGDLPSLSTKGSHGEGALETTTRSTALAKEPQSPSVIARADPLYDSPTLNGMDPAQLEGLLAAAAKMLAHGSEALPSTNEPPSDVTRRPKSPQPDVSVSTDERSALKPARPALSPDKRALLDGMTGAHG